MRWVVVLLLLSTGCRSRAVPAGEAGVEGSRGVVPRDDASARAESGSSPEEPGASPAAERRVVEEAPVVIPLRVRIAGLRVERVEPVVVEPLERAIGAPAGVREVRVRIEESGAEVEVLADRGAAIEALRAELEARVESLRPSWPAGVDVTLGATRGSPRFDVHYALSAPSRPAAALSSLHGELLLRPLLDQAGVAGVGSCGEILGAVHVVLDIDRLVASGSTPAAVRAAVVSAASSGSLTSMEALASLPVAEGEAGAIRLRDVAEVRTEERLVECSSSRCGAGSLAGCIRLRPPEPRGKPVRSIQADVARRLAELELPAGVSVSVDPPEGAGATDRVVLVVSGPDRSECRAAATALAMRLAATREVIAVVGPAPLEPTSVAAIDPDAVPQDGLDPAFLVAVPALVEGASVGAVALDGQRPRPLRLFADNDASGAAAATGRLERLGGLLPEGVTLPIRIVPTERPRRLLRLDGRPAETIGLRLAVRTTEVPSAVIDAAAGVPIPPDAILGWRLGESPP